GPQPAQRKAVEERDHGTGVMPGVGNLEHLEAGGREVLVGLEAALRSVLDLGVPRGAHVQLDLDQALVLVSVVAHGPLDLDGDLAEVGTALAEARRPRGKSLDLLTDEEQQALAQQVVLALEVIGQRAQRDPRGGGPPPVRDSADPLLAY